MKNINYKSIGSVVSLEGGTQKLMIIARGVLIKCGGQTNFVDYAAVPYPYGLSGENVVYFYDDKISEVIFEGYSDNDDKLIAERINKYIEETNPEKINIAALKKASEEK